MLIFSSSHITCRFFFSFFLLFANLLLASIGMGTSRIPRKLHHLPLDKESTNSRPPQHRHRRGPSLFPHHTLVYDRFCPVHDLCFNIIAKLKGKWGKKGKRMRGNGRE